MATSMKQWLTMVGVGVAVVATWLLPPGTFERPNKREVADVERRYRDVADDLRWSSEALKRHRWSDSLSALAVEGDQASFVSVPAEAGILEQHRDEILSRLRAAELGLGVRAPEVVLGFVIQPQTQNHQPQDPVYTRERRETLAGVRDGRPYCLQIQVILPEEMAEKVAVSLAGTHFTELLRDPLGGCRMYAQHGMPGERLQAWLESGGLGFGVDAGEPAPGGRSPEGVRTSRGRRALQGLSANRGPLIVDRCLAGDPDACRPIVLEPDLTDALGASEREIVRRSPATSVHDAALSRSLLFEERYMLSDLQAEFGPEAFAAFWRSDAEVAEAFLDAFDVELGAWVVSWIDSLIGIDPPGPTLPSSATFGTLLTVSLLAALAAAIAGRKKVA